MRLLAGVGGAEGCGCVSEAVISASPRHPRHSWPLTCGDVVTQAVAGASLVTQACVMGWCGVTRGDAAEAVLLHPDRRSSGAVSGLVVTRVTQLSLS